jgi:hypothetical protein
MKTEYVLQCSGVALIIPTQELSTSIQGHVPGQSATQPNKAGEPKLSTTTTGKQYTGYHGNRKKNHASQRGF